MRGCFLLQRSFAYTGHELVHLLRQEYGLTRVSAYVFTRASYRYLHDEQKDFRYDRLVLYEDVHKLYKDEPLNLPYLAFLEKEYGLPSLWPYLAVDRVLMSGQLVREYPYNTPPYSHEELLRIVQVSARNIIQFLEEEQPDFVFFSAIGSVATMLLYHIARKMGIKTVTTTFTSVENTLVLSESYRALLPVERRFAERLLLPERTADDAYRNATLYLKNFREHPRTYSKVHAQELLPTGRRKQLQFLRPKNLLRALCFYSRFLATHFRSLDRDDYSYISPWHQIIDKAKRKLRNMIGVRDLYAPFDPTTPYAFFPLHLEPEISLLLLAPYVTDQIALIRNIAKSLPVHFTLYVKEHPHMAPYRPRRFYQALRNIPNVQLVDPSLSSYEIITSAALVLSITGSVGWEASLLKKPVVIFGDAFYAGVPSIVRNRTLEELPAEIFGLLNRKETGDEELLQFLAALQETAVPIDLLYLWEQEWDREKKRKALVPLAKKLAAFVALPQQSGVY